MSTASDAEAERGARVFVGRQRELAELETHLGSTLSGRGGVVLLGGEPGIGKTRLLDELGVRARDAGVPPLWGRCWEEGGAPAYWPWVQILRAGLRHDEPARVASVIGSQAALLGALLPELPGAAPVAGTALPATGVESEHRRFALFDAVGSFFRTIAGPRRVLVLLDDVHAADGPSLRLLAFLARELREAPVLIVVAHRLLGLRASPILTETLAESAREGVAVQLGGLPEGDVARFIEVRAGIRPASGVVAELCLQTGGNPFFLDEVVRLLVADGHLTKAGGLTGVRRGVPFRVRDTIERRLEPLTPECGTLLRAAAVIGHEFTLRQVTMVTGIEPPVVLGLLDEAVTAGIVARTGSTGGFRFVHALFREFLYDGLPDAERTALHGRVGHVLEEQTGTRTAVLLAELAHHFLEATEGGGDVDRAVLYARRAAAEAMSRLAYEEAVGLCERALEALALQAPPDAAARAELLIDLGEAHQRTGALEAARSAFRDAASLARRTEPERAGPLLARAALGFAGLGPEVGRVDGTAVALLEDALATLDPAPGTLRARLLARLASELTYAAGDTRRYELSEEAVAMAERVDDPATLGYVLTRRLVVLMEPGNVEKRRALASSILAAGTADRRPRDGRRGTWLATVRGARVRRPARRRSRPRLAEPAGGGDPPSALPLADGDVPGHARPARGALRRRRAARGRRAGHRRTGGRSERAGGVRRAALRPAPRTGAARGARAPHVGLRGTARLGARLGDCDGAPLCASGTHGRRARPVRVGIRRVHGAAARRHLASPPRPSRRGLRPAR